MLSMTGFARQSGEAPQSAIAWVWELRSVNGKGLDVRFRLPNGCEALEQSARKMVATHLERGNVQAALTVSGDALSPVPMVNDAALRTVLETVGKLENEHSNLAPTSAADVLALRGVMEMANTQSTALADTLPMEALLASFGQALIQLVEMRTTEGASIANALNGQLNKVADLHIAAVEEPSRAPEALQRRLQEQMARVSANTIELDEDRLHQEIALLATRVDIQEELDRLAAHIDAARALLASDKPVGRRLEFLAQEFNREINTICSKSHSTALTEIGLELKVVIDQFREQALNIE
ncbi:MAG: YicC/YloC family endoribonuclease [Pseudomonadota bacterium]